MSVSSVRDTPYNSSVELIETLEEKSQPEKLGKRKIEYYKGLQKEAEKVSLVGDKAIAVSKGTWTAKEKETVKLVIERFCLARQISVENWHFDSKIMKESEMQDLCKNAKQVREKWTNHLNPNSLGGMIEECHKPIIRELSDKYPKQWSKMVAVFSGMDLPGKPAGKYYSSNAIKNYINNLKRKTGQATAKKSEGRSLSVTTTSSQMNEIPDFDEWCADKRKRDDPCIESIRDDLSEIGSLDSINSGTPKSSS